MTDVSLSPTAAANKLRDSLAADTGATAVGFTATGAGAAYRTVAQKLMETVSLADFGAVGDGVADDTDAIQAAMDYAADIKAMLVSPKNAIYLISAGLSYPSGLSADFRLSTIRRKPGSVFDLVSNTGGAGLRISNLILDGNCQADGLVSSNAADRFGGLVLTSVTDSEIRGVRANGTVNAEDGRAGIYLGNCTKVDLYSVGGADNGGSCVFIDGGSFNRIFGCDTADNLGSGLTSQGADDCEYYDCHSANSGYSGISINGKRCKGRNWRATGAASGYSGVNIGHDADGNRADDSIAENIHSYDNYGWGLTVVGSSRVQIRGIYLASNGKNNLRIFGNSSACQIYQLVSTLSGENGVLIQSGSGNKIGSADIFENGFHGIYVDAGCSVAISKDVRCFNNGTAGQTAYAGVLLNNATNCRVDAECFDDRAEKTQDYGIWVAGGSVNFLSAYVHENKADAIHETGSPIYVIRNTRTGTDKLSGVFAAAVSETDVVINNNNARAGMVVLFFPVNSAARTLGVPLLANIAVGASFTAKVPGAATGTETYGYVIV